jgi:hypothetical protein
MAQITFDPANEQDRVFIERILGADRPQSGPPAATANAGFLAAKLKESAGEGAKKFLELAAEHFGPDEEFTFDELAAATGVPAGATRVPAGTLKSWHRNLGRTATSRGIKLNDVLVDRWDDGRQHYRLPPAAHAAIVST